jgi:hypothetical protein
MFIGSQLAPPVVVVFTCPKPTTIPSAGLVNLTAAQGPKDPARSVQDIITFFQSRLLQSEQIFSELHRQADREFLRRTANKADGKRIMRGACRSVSYYPKHASRKAAL